MNQLKAATFAVLSAFLSSAADNALSLHDRTVGQFVQQLGSADLNQRTAAAESLGFLRARSAGEALVRLLHDDAAAPRRAAALSLAWCGGRQQVEALLRALDDSDWSVRQAAWVALTNLTGQEFPFEAHAAAALRAAQARCWREWWQSASGAEVPAELSVLPQLMHADLAAGCAVEASTTYKGPAAILTDSSRTGYWQTKGVPFPQHCTVDLGAIRKVGAVVVTQYGKGYCMTDAAVEISRDGREFREILRRAELTAPDLVLAFPTEEARFVRIVAHANEVKLYPTTFYQIAIFEREPDRSSEGSQYLSCERMMRALGALGCRAGSAAIAAIIQPYAKRVSAEREERWMVQSGIRALGQLAVAETRPLLVELLRNPQWARYAADALGDFGGAESAAALLAAYPDYAITDRKSPPQKMPLDDKPGFEAVDRMYETPYAMALALSRFTFEDQALQERLRALTPLLVMNMANDFDGAMLYEEQAFHRVNRYLLEQAGVCGELCELALTELGLRAPGPYGSALSDEAQQGLREFAANPPGATSFTATWLTALCRDRKYSPRLIQLLEHENGWVRINAAKTLMFMDEKSAVEPIAALLKASKTEAEYGWCTEFLFKNMKRQGQDEYNAPSPCWREAYTRALGALGSEQQVPLLTALLNDERNVLEVQYAAAAALDQIGVPAALAALQSAAAAHPFHSIKLKAREALWRRGRQWESAAQPVAKAVPAANSGSALSAAPATFDALVFIKGSNNMANDFQIDIWRQSYSTTDSGPTYRPGDNLYLLQPAAPEGRVTPLTTFDGGYVADCEVSWEGTHVLFARREKGDPWWHIWELELAGGRLTQLTSGPYHDVQPNYLADGRIVFSSSRTGMRDEYHGYPATGLTVMNRDGSGLHCIGFNLGRDNEPVMMDDGRILFSRLELFYSRLKTELTVQAVRPDGTMNATLYGPERRDLWQSVTRLSGEKGWGEAPPRHRVLRLTQPQPLNNQQVIVATTGGITVAGPGRMNERIIPRFNNMAVTTPFPLDEGRILCAATTRTFKREEVDLGLYIMDLESGALTLVYNDPLRADYEARPVMRRTPPRTLPATVTPDAFTARLMCNSARVTQEVSTRQRGKLLRIIEGQPVTSRHHTHTSAAGEAWKNHVGTQARVLGTVPLGADGSFYVEVPADRLLHCQILDSDRRVVGNQLIWMYARPGETRSCVGCHELPDTAGVALAPALPVSAAYPPIQCLPTGGEFSYRAKAWQKGTLSDETEERTRTVNAISFPGRM